MHKIVSAETARSEEHTRGHGWLHRPYAGKGGPLAHRECHSSLEVAIRRNSQKMYWKEICAAVGTCGAAKSTVG